jgi:hypothetical protein
MGIQRLRKVVSIDNRDWDFSWAHACLSDLERDRTISVPAEDAILFCVLVLFECKVLAALKTFVSDGQPIAHAAQPIPCT